MWQESGSEKTPWIRLLQPHSGSGKGFYFVPEIGEEVLVGFQGGNAEKPYVIGTQYNGKEKSGYADKENNIKAVHTRSGTKIILNDSEGSILIEDPSGNTYHMDGQGNIKVSAPRNISFTAGQNINISAGQNITTTAGMNISASAGMSYNVFAGGTISQNAVMNYTLTAANITEIAQETFDTFSNEYTGISGKVAMNSEENNIAINTPKHIQLKSNEKTINS